MGATPGANPKAPGPNVDDRLCHPDAGGSRGSERPSAHIPDVRGSHGSPVCSAIHYKIIAPPFPAAAGTSSAI